MGTRKKVYNQVFREQYSVEFPYIKKSEKGDLFAYCTTCRCDINIAHGGKTDITVHSRSAKHLTNVKCREESQKISNFFVKPGNADLDVIRAECLFTAFLVEHNIPLTTADHAGALLRKMFPNSEIAKKYGCARTKTAAIVSEMASDKIDDVVQYLQSGPFAVATDGSNDSNAKLYPIVVTFFDEKQEKIVNAVLSIPALEGESTGRNIGNLMLSQFESKKIPFDHCIALCSDNAAVMVGRKNGVAAVLKEKQNDIIVIGCSCHLINLAAEKAVIGLPIKIDEILVDIFYYLEKSSKRKERFHKFQELYNKEAKKILKHVCTRWLSLGRSLSRLVEQWDPLVSFFSEEVVSQKSSSSDSLSSYRIPKVGSSQQKPSSPNHVGVSLNVKNENERKRKSDCISGPCSSSKTVALASPRDKPILKNQTPIVNREEKLFMFLSSKFNKAICLFLLSVIPLFDKVNITLQSASPHIHVLRQLLCDFLSDLLSYFVKAKVIKSSSLLELDYHSIVNQKEDTDLVIGNQALNIARTLEDKEKSVFYSSVRKYFVLACDYIVNKFPLKNEVLKHAEVARLSNIENASFSSVRYFVELFPIMLAVKEGETQDAAIDEVQKQFTTLQINDISAICAAEVSEDIKWAQLASIRGVDGMAKYNRIARVMLSILSIPHSNAECERIFSLIKKNRTQFRSSMSNETLEAISILKCRQSGVCFEQNYSPDFLKKAKKATASSLKSQCSTSN